MKISEIFGPTIQGEGKSIGKNVIFLRLSMCNLACTYCDTAYTWNWRGTRFTHTEKHDYQFETHILSCEQVVQELERTGIRSLVISGGEPMLQQTEIIQLLKLLKQMDYWVEIETNGTIFPKDEFMELIDQINCSPKTRNSGPDNTLEMRERPDALRRLASSYKTNFKFVVENDDDMAEIEDIITRYCINRESVYLMTQCRNSREYYLRYVATEGISRKHGFAFTPRLQIKYFNGERGH